LTLRGNNFDNLQKLHDYGDFIYVIEHADYGSESDLVVESFGRGQEVGTLRGPPELTDPGYARPVDFGDGPSPKTVERVTLSETGDSVESTFEFSVRPRLARRVEELRRKQRDVEDQL